MSGATRKFIHDKMQQWPICVFSKRRDPDCLRAKDILKNYQQKMPFLDCEYVEIESRQDCEQIENYLQQLSLNDSRKVPQVYFRGKYFGSLFELEIKHNSKELEKIIESV